MKYTIRTTNFRARRVSKGDASPSLTLRALTTRRGLTLVELLVVISIIGLLGAIIGLIGPRFAERSRVAQGSSQLRSWLLVAKQRAMRDRAPRGLRFVPNPTTGSLSPKQLFYTTFAYVEQPEDITGVPTDPVPPQVLTAAGVLDPRRVLWLPTRNLAGIGRVGDVVEFGAARYLLTADIKAFPAIPNSSYMVLHRARDESRTAGQPLPPYRMTRLPQPIAGEPELNLPKNVGVDILFTNLPSVTASRSLPAPDVNAPVSSLAYEIIFGPSGEVTGQLANFGRIVLWLRDTSLNDPGAGKLPEGENRLLVIHTRTGQVTAHALNATVDMNGFLTDPYQFVRDGKSSALEE